MRVASRGPEASAAAGGTSVFTLVNAAPATQRDAQGSPISSNAHRLFRLRDRPADPRAAPTRPPDVLPL